MSKKYVVVTLLVALVGVATTQANLLEDPSFELATPNTQTSNSAWVLEVDFPDGLEAAAQFQEAAWASNTGNIGIFLRAFEGNQGGGGDPPGNARIFQDVGTGGSVLLDSVSLDLNDLSPNDGSWNLYEVSGVAPVGSVTVRAFGEMVNGLDALSNPQSAMFDDIDMTVVGDTYTLTAWHKAEMNYTSDATLIGIEFLGVPEPATMVLTCLGGLVLFAMRRRR